jgi:uncharacterized BrkB/YihY/UPF0761 family membrane protein
VHVLIVNTRSIHTRIVFIAALILAVGTLLMMQFFILTLGNLAEDPIIIAAIAIFIILLMFVIFALRIANIADKNQKS